MLMNTGAYRVQNCSCASCGEPLGWKFVRAAEQTEKWKEGYVVLELNLLDEEAFPLTPREEVLLPYRHRAQAGRLAVLPSPELGHRRSASSLSTATMRARPSGPRQRRASHEPDDGKSGSP